MSSASSAIARLLRAVPEMSLLGKWFGFTCEEIFDEAMVQFDQADYEEAIDAFQRCIDDSNVDAATTRLARFYIAESHAQLGKAKLRSGDSLAALRHFDAALQLFPNYPDLHLNAARSCLTLGARSRARAYLQRSLAANPSYAEAIALDAAMTYEDGDRVRGLRLGQSAIESDPSLGADRFHRAVELDGIGDTGRCAEILRSIAMHVHGNATLHARVADSYLREGHLQEAVAEYEAASRLAPGSADIRCKLGRVLVALGRPREALDHLRAAITVNPSHADAYAQAGLAHRLLGNGLEAIAAFQKAKEICPEHPLASQELRRVRGYVS